MRGVRRILSGEDAERAAQIESIIDDVVREHNAGHDVDDAAIERQYPDLLPELEQRLRTLRAVRSAARHARQQPSSGSSTGGEDSAFKEDLDYLRQKLVSYEILERVSYGGQGVVYKAVQRSTRRTVAIKVLLDGPLASERQRYRFAREAELISRVQHPNIVTLYEAGVVHNRAYFAMEYVEGVPVDDYVLLNRLSIAEIVRLFVPVCRAAGHAHQNGIIHRDLGPANILVDLEGVPRILDFGLAKDMWTDAAVDDRSFCTIPGQVFGTLPYMSPEQAGAGDASVDVRSDIYSLAMVLFELLTGGYPYPVDGDPAAVRANIVSREPLRLRKALSPGHTARKRSERSTIRDLEMILLKALSKDKAHRYQSAVAFADDLERYLTGEVVEARADNRFYLLHRTLRKYRAVVAVAALFLLVLGASTVAVTMMWVQARTQRDNAREMARQALATLDDVVTSIDESVSSLAGGMEVRDELLNHVVADRLARLRPLIESDIAMEDVRAALEEKQGDIAYAQGNHASALQHYKVFLEINNRAAQAEPSADDLRHNVARAHRKLARVSEDAVARFQCAVEIGRELTSRHPDALDPKYALCDTLIEFGRHLYRRGYYGRAAEQIDAALGIAEPVVASHGDDRRWCTLLARAYEWDGDTRAKLGDAERSSRSLEESLRLRKTLIQERPAAVDLRHALMLSYIKLGSLHRDAGRFDAATELFERAADAGEYLVNVEPGTATWKRDLHACYERLTRLFSQSGDLDRAQFCSDRATALAESLVQAEPANAEWRRILAFSLMSRGAVWWSRDEPGRAYADFEAELGIRRELSQSEPDNLALQAELASTYDWLAKCCVKVGQLQQAVTLYTRAHEVSANLLRLQPNMPQRALDVIRSKTNLASAYLAQHTPSGDEGALVLLRQAEEALVALRASGSLGGLEFKAAKWMEAIQENLRIATSRAQPHAPMESVVDEDALMPQVP